MPYEFMPELFIMLRDQSSVREMTLFLINILPDLRVFSHWSLEDRFYINLNCK